MNRTDLISRIAEQTNFTKKQAGEVLDVTINTIMDAVKTGDDVQLVGFGTFTAAHSKAREGRNPRTGETLHIPERKLPRFKAGKAFKAILKCRLIRTHLQDNEIPLHQSEEGLALSNIITLPASGSV